eukprot:1285431-Prymnesium_polylepis.1
MQVIDEEIYEEGSFLNSLVEDINFIIETEDPDTNGTWKQTWSRIKTRVKDASVRKTQDRRKKFNADLKLKIAQRDTLKKKVDDGSADAAQIAKYIELQEETRALKPKPSIFDSLEEIAYNMGKKHDTGSAAFCRPYTSRGSATWVNEVKEAT